MEIILVIENWKELPENWFGTGAKLPPDPCSMAKNIVPNPCPAFTTIVEGEKNARTWLTLSDDKGQKFVCKGAPASINLSQFSFCITDLKSLPKSVQATITNRETGKLVFSNKLDPASGKVF